MSVIAWIDLRDNVDHARLKLASVTADDGQQRRFIFIVGMSNQAPRWAHAIEKLGFVPSPRGKYLSRMVRDGEQLKASMFQGVWPNAIRAPMAVEDVRLNLAPGKHLRVAQQADIRSDSNGSTEEEREIALEAGVLNRLGRNAEGFEVFLNAAGVRFFKRLDGGLVYESSLSGSSAQQGPGAYAFGGKSFLRGRDAESLDACADGFVQCLLRGEPQHKSDLDQFIRSTTDAEGPHEPSVYEHFSALIDAALVRAITAAHDTAQDAYGDANRAYDMLPPYLGAARGAGAMPLPVSVIAQRLLGDTQGKRVIVPNAWDGASFAFLAPGSKIVAYTGSKNLSRHVQGVRSADVQWQGLYSPRTELEAEAIFFNADPNLDAGERLDYKQAFVCARTLQQQARAVFVLASDGLTGQIVGECKRFMQALGTRYEVEAAIEVPAGLCGRTGSDKGIRIIAIKNSPPKEGRPAVEKFNVVFSWDELKSHVDEVIATLALTEAQADGVDVDDVKQDNDFQRPYLAFSKVGEAVTMVPKNLQGPLQEALTNVERLYGPVDAYVEKALALGPNTLGQRFSPEQVDAIALGISRIRAGKGLIVGDETGIGKGRSLSAIATAALISGKKIIFVTDRSNLFSDLVRDLRDIGEWGRYRPLIMNADTSLMDTISNEIIAQGTTAAEMKRIVKDGLSMDDVDANIVFTTYSQLAQEESLKAEWLLKQTHDALVIVDEAHIAAGSNSNISSVIVDLTTQGWGAIYSSATWAKSSENLNIYARAFPDSINVGTLKYTMRAGGEAFSEVFSSMLAKDGAFIRREHDLSRIEFKVETDNLRTKRNNEISDSVAEIMSAMTYVSGEIGRVLVKLNSETMRSLRNARDAREASASSSDLIPIAGESAARPTAVKGNIFKSSFGSGTVLYQVMRRTLAVLNADNVIDLALRAANNDRKPVIVFEDTGESFLKKIIDQEVIPGVLGEADTVPDSVRVPNIQDFLRNIMKRMGVITKTVVSEEEVGIGAPGDENGAGVTVAATDDSIDLDAAINAQDVAQQMAEQDGRLFDVAQLPGVSVEMQTDYQKGIEKIMKMIDELPPIPLNVVDLIRARLEAEGLRCGELSGRSVMQVPQSGEVILPITDPGWRDQAWQLKKKVRNKTEINKTVWQFNSGAIDVILINRSAAAGISLHSSPRFADSRRRELIELQIPENSTDRIQLYGRVNRYDQVIPPIISIATTGILGEVRQLMMQNKKLARLSANIRSSRDNAAEIKMIPDLLNVVGEDVARRYLEDNGGIRSRLGITTDELERSSYGAYALIQKMTSRIALLRVVEQAQVYDELKEMYEDTMLQHEFDGENPLKPRELSIKAQVVKQKIFMGIDMEGIGSSFDGPVHIKKLEWKADYKPIRSVQLINMIASGRNELIKSGFAEQVVIKINPVQARLNLITEEVALRSDPLQITMRSRTALISPAIHRLELQTDTNLATPASAAQPLLSLSSMLEERRTERESPTRKEPNLLSETQWRAIMAMPTVSIETVAKKLAQIMDAKCRIELVGTEYSDLEEAIASPKENAVRRAYGKMNWIHSNMELLVPGRKISSCGDYGVITRLITPPKGREAQLSLWKIEYVIPGDEKSRCISLQTFMKNSTSRETFQDKQINIYDDVFDKGAEDGVSWFARRFEQNWAPVKKINAVVLDGNMYMASEWASSSKMGQGIIFTDDRGARHRGVLIKNDNRNAGLSLERMPIRLWSPRMLTNFLMDVQALQDEGGHFFQTNFKSAFFHDARDKGPVLVCEANEQMRLRTTKKDALRVGRAVQAGLKRMIRASVEGFDMMSKAEQKAVAASFPKATISSAANEGSVRFQCSGLHQTALVVSLLTHSCGLELYIEADSSAASLARDVQARHFSLIKEEWAAQAQARNGVQLPNQVSEVVERMRA